MSSTYLEENETKLDRKSFCLTIQILTLWKSTISAFCIYILLKSAPQIRPTIYQITAWSDLKIASILRSSKLVLGKVLNITPICWIALETDPLLDSIIHKFILDLDNLVCILSLNVDHANIIMALNIGAILEWQLHSVEFEAYFFARYTQGPP